MGNPFGIRSDAPRTVTPGTAVQHGPSGEWHGEALTRVANGAVGGPPGLARARRTGLAGPNGAHATSGKPLASRHLAPEARLASLPPGRLARAMVATANAAAARRLGAQLLRGGRLPPRDGRAATTRRSYLAARAASSLFDDDVDEHDALAMLTPLNYGDGSGGGTGSGGGGGRQPPENMQELHDLLRDVAETDRGKLAEMLADLAPASHERPARDYEPLPRDPDALYYALRPLLGDKAGLAERLRRAQGYPSRRDGDAVARLRQEIRDAASALESDERSTVFALVNGAQAAVDGAQAGSPADPARFIDAYTDLVKVGEGEDEGASRHGSSIFAKQFSLLLERFSAEELRNGVLETVRRALTDDLDAATRSRDVFFLSITVQHLRNLAGLTTLTEQAGKLTVSINRMRGATKGMADTSLPMDPTTLLRIVVGILASDYPSRMQVDSLVRRLACPDGGAPQVQLLQGLLGLMRALPMYMFKTDEDRLATITAIREILDDVIEQEEDEAAASDVLSDDAHPRPAPQ